MNANTNVVFTRTTAPVINARPADTNSFERKAGLVVDGSHRIEGGVEKVSIDKGIETGMALDPVIATDPHNGIDPRVIEMELFMAEELDIVLNEPASEMEPPYFEARVNGDYICARRDSQHPVKMKRYHVAILAQAKTATLKQVKKADSEGFQSYREEIVLRQSYPFSVLHDPSGARGAAWLRPLITNRTV